VVVKVKMLIWVYTLGNIGGFNQPTASIFTVEYEGSKIFQNSG